LDEVLAELLPELFFVVLLLVVLLADECVFCPVVAVSWAIAQGEPSSREPSSTAVSNRKQPFNFASLIAGAHLSTLAASSLL
jgi:hypothetical protein